MASNLQVNQNLTATAQPVKDQNGTTSPLTLAVDQVGIGTTTPNPGTKLDVAGQVVVLSDTNPLYFTSEWRGMPSAELNAAEISNNTTTHKTLMIVGNYSAGSDRRVSVWDTLQVGSELHLLNDLNPLHFTSVWKGWPSTGVNHAEICNDTTDHKALMIV